MFVLVKYSCNVYSSFGIYYVALYVHASVKNKSVNITDTLLRTVNINQTVVIQKLSTKSV